MQSSPFALLLAAALTLGALTVPASAAATDVKIDIVTTMGTIEVVLDPVHAPATTKNFLRYVDTKFFDGGTFFRAVPGFVIQGGNKDKEAGGYPPIKFEKTGVKNIDGAIAMARTSDPDSANSEFFIDDGAQPRLDGSDAVPGYAAFGHVTKGMDVVRKIVNVPAIDQQITAPVKILRVRRVK